MNRWSRSMLLLSLWLGFGAQAFEGVSYQGTLTDVNGNLLSSGRYTLEFNLYKTQSDSTPVWGPQVFDDGIGTPGHSYKVEVENGMFSVVLGERDTQGRLLSEAFMKNAGFLLLGLKVDGGPEIQPRQQIMPAPYAFRALSAPLPRVAVVTPSMNPWQFYGAHKEPIPGLKIDNLELRPGSYLLVSFTGKVRQYAVPNVGQWRIEFEIHLVVGDEKPQGWTSILVGGWAGNSPLAEVPVSFSQLFGPFPEGKSFTDSNPIEVHIHNHSYTDGGGAAGPLRAWIEVPRDHNRLLAEEIIVESLSP
jgi:hypothetical protein